MGRQLPWGHKHLHVEAEDNKPKANHVGRRKRREKVKGKKARFDELLALKRRVEYEIDWVRKTRARVVEPNASNYGWTRSWVKRHEESCEEAKQKFAIAIADALIDEVITVEDVARLRTIGP